jgi:thiamine-monophosphate kinase
MNEQDVVRRLASRRQPAAGVVRGIGDDCAILRLPPREELLIHTDLTIENIHFRRSTHTARAVGQKTLARGLSDIAAMGGTPRWALLSLALPDWVCGQFLNDFYDGVFALGERFHVSVVGGDLSRARQFAADVVILGSAPRGKALRRDTAKHGDGVYISGSLGHAAASKYREIPEPRIALGRWLRSRATACMDLSDGLSLDLHRLCWESKVAAELDRDPPLAPRATRQQALSGGEDYELLFTASRKLPAAFQGLSLTRIGTIVKGPRGRVKLGGKPLKAAGWDHFRSYATL